MTDYGTKIVVSFSTLEQTSLSWVSPILPLAQLHSLLATEMPRVSPPPTFRNSLISSLHLYLPISLSLYYWKSKKICKWNFSLHFLLSIVLEDVTDRGPGSSPGLATFQPGDLGPVF